MNRNKDYNNRGLVTEHQLRRFGRWRHRGIKKKVVCGVCGRVFDSIEPLEAPCAIPFRGRTPIILEEAVDNKHQPYWEGRRTPGTFGTSNFNSTRTKSPQPGVIHRTRRHLAIAYTWQPGSASLDRLKFICHRKCGLVRVVKVERLVDAYVSACESGRDIVVGVDI